MRRLAIALLLAAFASPALAAGLTDATVRQFLAGQEAAWNARRLDTYFAAFTRDAMFVDQTVTPKETITYGRSTLAEAKAFARKSKVKSVERGTVRSVSVAADGRSARVLGYEITTIETAGKVRQVCANTQQDVVLQGGRILSKGQTDSIIKCPKAPN